MTTKTFHDRSEAGQELAKHLVHLKVLNPVVLALPRGGVPVASEIARALQAPMELLIVKKIGAPENEEFAVGAVSENGIPVLDEETILDFHINRRQVLQMAEFKIKEVQDQMRRLRGHRAKIKLSGRTVIVVDDGLAMGSTMITAIRALKESHPVRIVIASPIASKSALERIYSQVDEVVILSTPDPFVSVGCYYDHFPQVTDREVIEAYRR